MSRLNKTDDYKVEDLLVKLADDPERDLQAAKNGRVRFLAQARELTPPVSEQQDWRHRGWNKIFFERIFRKMKPKLVFSIVSVAILVGVVSLFVVNNITTVSAQQILDKASAAQSMQTASQGIRHFRFEILENPQAQEGGGVKKVVEVYEGPDGHSRFVTWDDAGSLLNVSASDGSYVYWSKPAAGNGGKEPLIVSRIPVNIPEKKQERMPDPVEQDTALFRQFHDNPRVRVEGVETWEDGRRVYVLVDDNYQAQKQLDGQIEQNYTGKVKMVFDTQTYELVESQISLYKNDKDVVINSVKYLANEILPVDSPVAWDLSDLKGLSIVDEPNTEPADDNVEFQVLSLEELLTHTPTYVLKPIPDGYTMEIGAVTNQPKDEPYAYEINYTKKSGETFGIQAIGLTDQEFINSNFYDGSYKTATGLTLYFSTSSNENNTSAILTTPEGTSFLVICRLPREQVQALAEDLVRVP